MDLDRDYAEARTNCNELRVNEGMDIEMILYTTLEHIHTAPPPESLVTTRMNDSDDAMEVDLPTMSYSHLDSGAHLTRTVDKNLYLRKRRDLLDCSEEEHKFWSGVEAVLKEMAAVRFPDDFNQLPILSLQRPFMHTYLNHLLIQHSSLADKISGIMLRLDDIWTSYQQIYGTFNSLQVEERVVLDKFYYLLRNYQLAVAEGDLPKKRKMLELMMDLKNSLLTLLTYDYATREKKARRVPEPYFSAFNYST